MHFSKFAIFDVNKTQKILVAQEKKVKKKKEIYIWELVGSMCRIKESFGQQLDDNPKQFWKLEKTTWLPWVFITTGSIIIIIINLDPISLY